MRRCLLIVGMVLSTSLMGCDRKPASAAAGAGGPPPAFVTFAVAQSKDVPVYLDEIGRCVGSEYISVQPQVTGVIKEIHFVDGADVKKGQMLFTIDPRPYEAALSQSKAMLSMNSATLTLMKQEWDRVQGLVNNAISKEEIEQRQNAVSVSEAQVEAAHANIAAAQVNLDYCYIKSPTDGRAGQRLVDVGNVVTPSSSMTMLTIQKLDPIYADFTITENHLAEVRKFMSEHTLRTQVWTPDDASNGIAPHEGDLTFLNNAVQDNTGTIKLRATLPNADHHFWPGQFVNVRLVLHVEKNAVLVPLSAKQIGQQGQFVFVAKEVPNPKDPEHPMMFADQRLVEVGQDQPGDMLVIQRGVAAGEKVVASGQMMVRPGGMLLPKPPSMPPQPAGAPATGPTTTPSTAPAQ